MDRFGEKLRTLRQQRGLTMLALAKEIGFATHGYLGDLESGRAKPSLELALTIADYFGVSVDALARDEVELPEDDQLTSLSP
jgi:transcriptional regulator with XRE-family HTH domain